MAGRASHDGARPSRFGQQVGTTGQRFDPVMALSEFFPYGAPELIEGAAARMARSTLGASLGVALLVATLGAMVTRGFTQLPVISGEPDVLTWEPPPSVAFPEPLVHSEPEVKPAPPTLDPHAFMVPVPDLIAPEFEDHAPVLPNGPVGAGPANDPPSRTKEGGLAPPTADPLPSDLPIVDEYPALIRSVEAHYPDLAREAGVEGLVRVLMLVGPDGRVQRAIVAPAGSVPMLDAAALEAARLCVFTPAITNGHPVKVWVSRHYRFRLH